MKRRTLFGLLPIPGLILHRLILFCILSLLMLVLLLFPGSHFSRSSPAIFAQDVPEDLMWWPMSADGTGNDGYLYVSEAFGPREARPGKEPIENWFHVGLDMCSERPALKGKPIYNPFNEDVEIYDKGGTSPYKWFAIKNLNENHEVKYVAFWHVNTDNIIVGNVYGPGQDFPVTIDQNTDGGKHDPHLHFEVYTDRFSIGERNKLTKNPVRWLDYDYDACEDNEAWYAFDSEYVPDEGTDLGYLEVTVKQHHDCLDHDKVIVHFGPGSNEEYLIGGNVIGLNERKSLILDDLTVRDDGACYNNDSNYGTAVCYNNRYYEGHKIIAEHWGSACDRDLNNKYTVKYRFYFKPGVTFDQGDFVSITLKDVYDYTWASEANAPVFPCVGCYPPDNAPFPPTSLTAVTQDEGVLLSWTSSPSYDSRMGFGYLIYRRDVSSPDIRSAIPIAYITNQC